MKHIKQLVAALMFAVILVPATRAVEPVLPDSFVVATPVAAASVVGQTTTNALGVYRLDNAATIAVQLTTVSTAANTSNVVVTINESLDGVVYSGTVHTITLAGNGTTAANAFTNLTAGAMKHWRFNVNNQAAATVTNTVSIKTAKKPGL